MDSCNCIMMFAMLYIVFVSTLWLFRLVLKII